MPKLACCQPGCGTCINPCDPPTLDPDDYLAYFTPCESYVGPPTCGWPFAVDAKSGGMPMNPTGAGCGSAFSFCPDSAPSVAGSAEYLCLGANGSGTWQWNGVTCPSSGSYPFPACAPIAPGEIGGLKETGFCNPTACGTQPPQPCLCPSAQFTQLSGGALVVYSANDITSPFYDPQPWRDVIEVERVCCWRELPPGGPWFTISGSGDVIGIGENSSPFGQRCRIFTRSASGQGIANTLRTVLGTDYKVTILGDEVYWAGGQTFELLFGGCSGKLMSCSDDGCSCKGRYNADDWRINYIDECRVVIQARHDLQLALQGITVAACNNRQEIEVPPGSGNYFCRCAGSASCVSAIFTCTDVVLIEYGVNITGSSWGFDYDFNLDPNQCDGAPGNCTWCNMGGSVASVT